MKNQNGINTDYYENGSAIKEEGINESKKNRLYTFQGEELTGFNIGTKSDCWSYFTPSQDKKSPIPDDGGNRKTDESYLSSSDRGSSSEDVRNTESKGRNYTLEEYASENRLPGEWLKRNFFLKTMKDSDGTQCLKIPYYKEDRSEATYRKCFANKESAWKRGSSKNVCLYGEWDLEAIQESGYVVMVEEEYETQVLRYMNIRALGVPGIQISWKEAAQKLEGLKIFIFQEPGKKGERFFNKTVSGLRYGKFKGHVYKISGSAVDGARKPSSIFLKYDKDYGHEKITDLMECAEQIDIEQSDDIHETITDSPVNLRQPDGWKVSDQGIAYVNPKTFEECMICRTPIIITKRIKRVGTEGEKIEIAFKRDERWHKVIFTRSELFTARGIIKLADYGCTVTSENAKMLVMFLSDLEAENIDALETAEATNIFGWQTNNQFIPGGAEDIIMDIDPNQKELQDAYNPNGKLDEWIDSMKPYRERNKFRFILAASFAAPLLKIVNQRNFFIYYWAESKNGKTASLKAALSIWGDPEKLPVNFRATSNGLEKIAAFYCDLPLGIDETTLERDQAKLEEIVYMISNGTGKVRAAKSGGLQEISHWRTIALTNGEAPLSTDTTQNGVNTRMIELYANDLFENEMSAHQMHNLASQNYGVAGPEFIRHVIGAKKEDIIKKFNEMSEYLGTISKDASVAHIDEIAVVSLADAMADTWLFKNQDTEGLQIDPESWERAKQMGKTILKAQIAEQPKDMNENAVQFITDWIFENKAHFRKNKNGNSLSPCLGWMTESEDTIYIFPNSLKEALEKSGYNKNPVMKYMANHKLIGVKPKANGKGVDYSVSVNFDKASHRFVEFYLGKYLESEADPAPEGNSQQEVFTPDAQGFVHISQEDQKRLPFD